MGFWVLFSKRITGKATICITLLSLGVNLVFKILLPLTANYKLNRAHEMILGVGLPCILLLGYELFAAYKGNISREYLQLQEHKAIRKAKIEQVDEDELLAIRRQNKFGLKVISFSLVFIALLLYILCAFTNKGTALVVVIASIILLCSLIPFLGSRKISV